MYKGDEITSVSADSNGYTKTILMWKGCIAKHKWEQCSLVYDDGTPYVFPHPTVKQQTLNKKILRLSKTGIVAYVPRVEK